MASPVITLTTDFGLTDGYVAVMKGVLLRVAPQAEVVDISHEVPPQDVQFASFVLRTSYPYFPNGTVHLAVVDPGVGTKRKAVAVATKNYVFVGPDNGVLAPSLEGEGVIRPETGEVVGASAVELTSRQYWLDEVSQTFHGRDIFTPVAAHLANGTAPQDLGTPLTTLRRSPIPAPQATDEGLRGEIIHVDHFGNAISNIPRELIPRSPEIHIAGHILEGLTSSYQDAEVVAIVGSSGFLEIGVREASASRNLGLKRGDSLFVKAGQVGNG